MNSLNSPTGVQNPIGINNTAAVSATVVADGFVLKAAVEKPKLQTYLKLHCSIPLRRDQDIFVARVTTNPALEAAERGHSVLLLEDADFELPDAKETPFLAVLAKGEARAQLLELSTIPFLVEPFHRGDEGIAEASVTSWMEPVILPPDLDYLGDEDVVKINPRRGELQVIYRRQSPFNHLFVTERCNSKCLMCSQPPREVDDRFRIDDLLAAIPLFSPQTQAVGFTGGEITLLQDGFLDLLHCVHDHLPQAHVQVLSNGRLFTYLRYAEAVADIGIEDLMMCVPLYSDVDSQHDFIVQSRGAFDQTIRGLINLGRAGVPVEIRVVIHRQTYERLPQLAQFIARNLPFASHVALMGLEMTGFTRANLEALWIDPIEYVDQLREAVDILDAAGLNVSIFNHQLCLLPRELWPFSRQSISDWKNIYLPPCDNCQVQAQCGGFFASATVRHSAYIQPFLTEI